MLASFMVKLIYIMLSLPQRSKCISETEQVSAKEHPEQGFWQEIKDGVASGG